MLSLSHSVSKERARTRREGDENVTAGVATLGQNQSPLVEALKSMGLRLPLNLANSRVDYKSKNFVSIKRVGVWIDYWISGKMAIELLFGRESQRLEVGGR